MSEVTERMWLWQLLSPGRAAGMVSVIELLQSTEVVATSLVSGVALTYGGNGDTILSSLAIDR